MGHGPNHGNGFSIRSLHSLELVTSQGADGIRPSPPAPFRLLTLRALQAPLDLTALDHAELEQISYRRPGTAGELIFNYWD